MRYAFVSDIHANLQAWTAVLADIRAQRVDRIICLGDIVGYGPRPDAVLSAVYAHVHHFVLGNHDAAAAGLLDTSAFNADAERMIQWTRERLDRKARAFFRGLPLVLRGDGFRCVHGDFRQPDAFYYLVDEEDARASWQQCPDRLLLVGHSHVPRIHLLHRNDRYKAYEPVDFVVEDDKRYVVNVGSLGMPRDGDFRACYCLYDSARSEVSWQRVAYDIDAFRTDVEREIGHSAQTDAILRLYAAQEPPPLRELLVFSPSAGSLSRGTVREEEIGRVEARARRWRRLAALSLVLLLAVVGAGLALFLLLPRARYVRGPFAPPLSAARLDQELDLLPGAAGSDRPASGWAYRLGNARQQHVRRLAAGLVIESADAQRPFTVELPMIDVRHCGKLQFMVRFRAEDADGALPTLVYDYYIGEELHKAGAGSKAPHHLGNGEYRIQHTTDPLPQRVTHVAPRLSGRFTGRLCISELRVSGKP